MPSDLDIFWPSLPCTKPCARTARGRGRPTARRMAGQMTQWNQMMSLPMRCTSHGQKAEVGPSGWSMPER